MNVPFRLLAPFLLVLAFLLGIALGYRLDDLTGDRPAMFAARDFNRLEEILNHIDYNYVDTVDTDDLMRELVTEYLDREEVIDQIFRRLDPHSGYIPATSYRTEQENLSGRFEGIGIEFNIVHDTILVVTPISGGPSERLGIRPGDKIITVEDSVVAGVGIDNRDVMRLLRGPKGSRVNVGIRRQGEADLLVYEIMRDQIPLFSLDVAYMVDDEVGYLKLNRFSEKTIAEFEKGLDELVEAGAKKLILDLRGNPGGFLVAATRVADEFLGGRRMIVYTEGKSKPREEYKAGHPGAFEKGDVVVLIDEGSASASEIVAGALQDHDRALVVGRRSFGKGRVQEIYNLDDSSAIRLTVARYYTPSGRCIQRSYDNGVDAYYEEYLDRLRSGGSVPDSVRLRAQLGYGIIPDVVLPMDTGDDRRAFLRIWGSGAVSRFAYDYYARHPYEFEKWPDVEKFRKNHEVSGELYTQLVEALRADGVAVGDEQLERIRPWIETALRAQFARQLWKNEGFYPVFHDLDPEFLRAYELIREGRKLDYDAL